MLELRKGKLQSSQFVQEPKGQTFASMEMDFGYGGRKAQPSHVQTPSSVSFESGMGECRIRVSYSDPQSPLPVTHSAQPTNSQFCHPLFGCLVAMPNSYTLYSSSSAGKLFLTMWRNSRGHNSNMLYPLHRCVGVGVYGDGALFYATQIFSGDPRVCGRH